MPSKRALFSWLLVGSLAVPVVAQEARPPQAEGSKPATAAAEIERLIQELGDRAYRVRRAAERALAEMGTAAVPALQKASKDHTDDEVQWRARRLLRKIEGGEPEGLRERRGEEGGLRGDRAEPRSLRPELGETFEELFRRLERDFDMDIPRRKFFQDEFFQDLEAQMKAMRRGPGGFDEFGESSGQSMQMSVGPDGVSLEITENNEAGESETKRYQAPDMAAFRAKYPEIAEKYLGRGSRGLSFRFGPDRDWPQIGEPDIGWMMPSPRGRLPLFEDQRGPMLGVLVTELDENELSELGVGAEKGLHVQSVLPGSLAERIGVEADDVVLEIGGEAVGSAQDVTAALQGSGDEVVVRVHRGGESVTLGESKAKAKPKGLKPRGEKKRVR